jgi:hypothetical protein
VTASLARLGRVPWRLMLAESAVCLLAIEGYVIAEHLADAPGPSEMLAVGLIVLVPAVPLTGGGTIVGYRIGALLGRLIRPGFESLLASAHYFEPLIWPSVGFAIGYLSLAVIFAGYYAVLNQANPAAFKVDPDGGTATLSELAYFAIMNQLTLENYRIQPLAWSARIAVIVHGLLTVGWNLLFFAAMTAYVGRFWARMDDEEDAPTAPTAPPAPRLGPSASRPASSEPRLGPAADTALRDLDARITHLEQLMASQQTLAAGRHAELLAEIRAALAEHAGAAVPAGERGHGEHDKGEHGHGGYDKDGRA